MNTELKGSAQIGEALRVEETTEIRDMSEERLELYIYDIVAIEDTLYPRGKDDNTELHKSRFISGGRNLNVSTAKLPDGTWLVSRTPEEEKGKKLKPPKTPEFLEAIVKISEYFEKRDSEYYEIHPKEREEDKIDIMSEVVDLTYNVMGMAAKNSDFREEYKSWVRRLSTTLGYTSNRELFMLTVAKYKSRIKDQNGKNLDWEQQILTDFFKPKKGKKVDGVSGVAPVKLPSDNSLIYLYDDIVDLNRVYNEPRFEQIMTDRIHAQRIQEIISE